jgi:hypothetical protein
MLGIAIADNAYVMDCSELCARLLRAGGGGKDYSENCIAKKPVN